MSGLHTDGRPADATMCLDTFGMDPRLNQVTTVVFEEEGDDVVRATSVHQADGSVHLSEDVAHPLNTAGGKPGLGYSLALIEGEGDAVADIYDPPPDGRRYAACGDGVAAPCAHWIGLRLRAVAGGRDPDGATA